MGSKNKPKPLPASSLLACTHPDDPSALLYDIQQLITETRAGVSAAVNTGLTLLYWRVGERIRRDLLLENCAEYGKRILPILSAKLTQDYGRGWSERNLAYMVRFAEAFPKEQIVVTLSRQLSWSHFLALLPLEKPFQRDFYAEMCRIEGLQRAGLTRMLYGQMGESARLDAVMKENLEGLGYEC